MKKWTGDDIDPESVVEPAKTPFGGSPDDSSDELFREDIVVEPEEKTKTSFGGSSDAASTEAAFRKLRDELVACRKEKQDNLDGWQRSKADYVNLLKRLETETKSAELKGKVGAVETLLPAFDALERAKEHVSSEALAKEGGEMVAGFMAVAKQLEGAFASLGLQEIGKAGEAFDPALHEAFGQDPVESADQDGVITAILEKGWRIGDSVIRPAKVRVGQLKGG